MQTSLLQPLNRTLVACRLESPLPVKFPPGGAPTWRAFWFARASYLGMQDNGALGVVNKRTALGGMANRAMQLQLKLEDRDALVARLLATIKE